MKSQKAVERTKEYFKMFDKTSYVNETKNNMNKIFSEFLSVKGSDEELIKKLLNEVLRLEQLLQE